MRLVSVLLAGIAAACAYAAVRELLPGHPALSAGAGLLVAMQPMYGFISGVVNNDAGIAAGAAVLLYLLVRGLRRGVAVPRRGGIGGQLAALPPAHVPRHAPHCPPAPP